MVGISPQRRDDWDFAFQVRPVLVELDGRRVTITPHEAQVLLTQLGRLPRSRHQAAEDTAAEIVNGLASGSVISLGGDSRPCVLRAIEGLRLGGGLPTGLAKLRISLVHSAEPVV